MSLSPQHHPTHAAPEDHSPTTPAPPGARTDPGTPETPDTPQPAGADPCAGTGIAGAGPPAQTLERTAQLLIMLTIGAAAGAGSFTHVHDVAATHGQTGWLAWSDAVVLELMSIAAGLELRRRKRTHTAVAFPAIVMATAVVVSLSAQVVDAERSPIGWVAAAIPALGFLVMVKIALAQPGRPAASALPAVPPVAEPPSSAVEDRPRAGDQGTVRVDPVVQMLVPVARTAADRLAGQGHRLSRHAVAEGIRAQGYAVSNARASALLAIVKAERGDAPVLRVVTPTAGSSPPP